MRPRPTLYKGIRMRSRLEATYAQFLDNRQLSWEYEPECFADETGQYLPDFYVPTTNAYVEVKPRFEDVAGAMPKMDIIRQSADFGPYRHRALVIVVPVGRWPEVAFAIGAYRPSKDDWVINHNRSTAA